MPLSLAYIKADDDKWPGTITLHTSTLWRTAMHGRVPGTPPNLNSNFVNIKDAQNNIACRDSGRALWESTRDFPFMIVDSKHEH